MASSSSQHRCVFVGNIPYDATEEQLIDICREVGPVVSFRLVIDRETGKPKGYGFCEYKDEETALSARRNLQGYEINGRQLRVDFAENDKNSDRNREQGRGGPGLAANTDPHRQVGGPAVLGESAQHQPIGLKIAISAAHAMSGALGGAQGMQSNQNALQGQSASDPLTLHLAKMSRSQLIEIVSEMKLMATQNRDAAHQLLVAKPLLSKALFQAQIMLGMVTPQVLQMPNLRQSTGQPAATSLQDAKQGQQPAGQAPPGLPPHTQRMHPGLVPKMQEGHLPAVAQNSSSHGQFSTSQPPLDPRTLIPHRATNHVLQQPTVLGQPKLPPPHPALTSITPQTQLSNASTLNPKVPSSLLQHTAQVATLNTHHNSQMVLPNRATQSTLFPHPVDSSFQLGPSISSGISVVASKDAVADATWPKRSDSYSNMQTNINHDFKEPSNRPSKMLKLEDGTGMSFSTPGSNVLNGAGSGPSQNSSVSSVPLNPLPTPDVSQLPPDESELLQQVLNLTPEQLSSLPPEQQQQVIQLQQALRLGQMQQ
ncbi:hypothetical protein Tsubulata_008036 [Turnera subulata]|uniref:RRM domain-containing protein n=1 Tax=Turnera subulata TaxID=218843 RepID=A0A9Q0FR84_9ROSI|nr:hypothetical protein Tsubulata_008036 [Turnera subulata]